LDSTGTDWVEEDEGQSAASSGYEAGAAWGSKDIESAGSSVNAVALTDGTSDGIVGVQIAIAGGQPTEYYTWILSDTATVGSDIIGFKAGLDDGDDDFDVIVKKLLLTMNW